MRLGNLSENRIGDFAVDIENLIDHIFGDQKKSEPGSHKWIPRASVSESDTAYRVTVELPGLDTEDVSIEMHESSLMVSGEKKIPVESEEMQSIKSERQTGTFSRTFKFPVQIEPDDIKASFENGVLTVGLPKSAKSLPRKISIS